ncbi:hypothetical protein [Oceanisphaera avium]|uniref:Uncharacterized protein n=1 Tax=Oceanisphaera avium TaxID=1903694 RepID=A0A1Y0D1H5_9GAMM|nr:hypothetical protein [Oceanisphaera avium]ART80955.1 hypothetical protein CBP12_12975 [Oceanisphaera avium]
MSAIKYKQGRQLLVLMAILSSVLSGANAITAPSYANAKSISATGLIRESDPSLEFLPRSTRDPFNWPVAPEQAAPPLKEPTSLSLTMSDSPLVSCVLPTLPPLTLKATFIKQDVAGPRALALIQITNEPPLSVSIGQVLNMDKDNQTLTISSNAQGGTNVIGRVVKIEAQSLTLQRQAISEFQANNAPCLATTEVKVLTLYD